jgi:hypothetical protein
MAWRPASLGEWLDDLAPPGKQGEAETGWVSKQAEEHGGRGRPGGQGRRQKKKFRWG